MAGTIPSSAKCRSDSETGETTPLAGLESGTNVHRVNWRCEMEAEEQAGTTLVKASGLPAFMKLSDGMQ
jgi:hypothetical protein